TAPVLRSWLQTTPTPQFYSFYSRIHVPSSLCVTCIPPHPNPHGGTWRSGSSEACSPDPQLTRLAYNPLEASRAAVLGGTCQSPKMTTTTWTCERAPQTPPSPTIHDPNLSPCFPSTTHP
ncbi:hypothetical protein Cadr_000031145, partial [Camelus dromedarius]